MRTKLLLAFLMLLISQTKAQNVENPSFDSVYIGGIDRIHDWITSDSWATTGNDTVLPLTPDDHYISVGMQYHELLHSVQLEYSNAFDGSLAIKVFSEVGKVKNDGSPFRGFIVNGNHFYTDNNGYIALEKGGEPFPHRPYMMRGHYKFDDQSPSLNNYPKAIVLLKKYNPATFTSDTIGYAELSPSLVATSVWTLFEMPINYLSSQTPDSIVVAFLSPGIGAASTFWIDSLGFDFTFPSSIDEEANADQTDFYVNHSEDKIYFTNSESVTSAKIYNVSGQLILSDDLNSSTIDISGLADGIFFLNLEYRDNRVRVFKILN